MDNMFGMMKPQQQDELNNNNSMAAAASAETMALDLEEPKAKKRRRNGTIPPCQQQEQWTSAATTNGMGAMASARTSREASTSELPIKTNEMNWPFWQCADVTHNYHWRNKFDHQLFSLFSSTFRVECCHQSNGRRLEFRLCSSSPRFRRGVSCASCCRCSICSVSSCCHNSICISIRSNQRIIAGGFLEPVDGIGQRAIPTFCICCNRANDDNDGTNHSTSITINCRNNACRRHHRIIDATFRTIVATS